MVRPFVSALRQTFSGVLAAIRAKPGMFLAASAVVLLLNVLLPPLVLSVARKPVDYITFNPWLKSLPAYLVSGDGPLSRKLDFVLGLAVFWFSSDGIFGIEWGYAVTVGDLLRILLMSLILGACFAVWTYRRETDPPHGWASRYGRRNGVAGALVSVLGLSTAPCSVMGCGAPVIPVVGLAFVGLSSSTVALLSQLSTIATAVVFASTIGGLGYLGWRVGARPSGRRVT
jgi:hypothetical protein